MADETKNVSRREFLTGLGGLGFGAVLGGAAVSAFALDDGVVAFPASEGYLLVDSKKCMDCKTCMLMCSLAHTGTTNLSLSRIQIDADPFGHFPNDLTINQCRQCAYPACVDACPVKAMHIDAVTGIRTVDEDKCIGCERCVQACPYTPSRVQWNPVDRHAQKCDLCANTPHWDEEGGPDGKQACVEACPMKAIRFTKELPVQSGDGYDVNLRNKWWGYLGFPTDDAGVEVPWPSWTPGA